MKCRIKSCNSSKFRYTKKVFKDKTIHYQRNCKKCGAHNYYGTESEALSSSPRKKNNVGTDLMSRLKDKSSFEYRAADIMYHINKDYGEETAEAFIKEWFGMYADEKEFHKLTTD